MTLSSFFQGMEDRSSALYREFLWILEDKFNHKEAELISGKIELGAKELKVLWEWLDKKNQDYPLQYFLGSTDFMGFNFFVEPGVLIPRMETEEIVAWILENKDFFEKEIAVLDIGAGSGCMGISLAKKIKKAKILSLIEPYKEACKSLEKNIAELCQDENFLTELIELPFERVDIERRYDLIVSNPPYIRFRDEDVARGVYEFEPHEALFGGEKGYEKYKAWVSKAYPCLKEGGILVMEFSHDQRAVLEKILQDYRPQFFKDSFGKDRFFVIEK